MSRSKWEDWVVNGGQMPTLELPEVASPDYTYICLGCGRPNNYWKHNCESCDIEMDCV